MPPLYFAPMEGVTDIYFRRAHHRLFGGIDKYFVPFISPTQNLTLTPKELAEILPENNEGMNAVPQIMTKHAEHFRWAAREMQAMGYREINLNMGCPSGTVTGKGKGSGLLRHPDRLRALLDEIYAHSPIPVSLKTRIGYLSEEEWPALLEVLRDYPVHELIIHPRTRKQFYKGEIFEEAYQPAFDQLSVPIVLNGDLFTPEAVCGGLKRWPSASAVMLGRGLIANPALALELKGGAPLTRDRLISFHDALLESYLSTGNPVLALVRMRIIAYYMASCFEDAQKPWKIIRKATALEEYLSGIRQLFAQPFLPAPYYHVLSD